MYIVIQGSGAGSTHTSQYSGCGTDLWRHQVHPDCDSPISQLICAHHEQLHSRSGCPSAKRRRFVAVLRWQQLHYLHEGRGRQVRQRSICSLAEPLQDILHLLMIPTGLCSRKLSHHHRKQDLRFWKGERPIAAAISLSRKNHPVHGRRWRSCFLWPVLRWNRSRLFLHIECPYWSVGWVKMSWFQLQVMKMVMTLTALESGCIHYVKRAGASLEPGCVIAKLQLDDPTRVQQVSCRSDALLHACQIAICYFHMQSFCYLCVPDA